MSNEGLLITTIHQSKGREFSSVVLLDPGESSTEQENSTLKRKHLLISLRRLVHEPGFSVCLPILFIHLRPSVHFPNRGKDAAVGGRAG